MYTKLGTAVYTARSGLQRESRSAESIVIAEFSHSLKCYMYPGINTCIPYPDRTHKKSRKEYSNSCVQIINNKGSFVEKQNKVIYY